jgi:hypothetical protein
MDNKKFEKLIDLIINENEEQAKELFHEIVVEKSREIYESIMDEEMMDGMDEGMGGQVGDLLDEINAEESGEMNEAEDDMEMDDMEMDDDGMEMDDEVVSLDSGDDVGDDTEEIEDAVVRIEDKLDQLMADFERIMGDEDMGDDDMGDMGDDDMGDMGDEEGEEEVEDEEEEKVMEAVTLKKVGGQTYNTFGKMGDNGVQTKSPGLQNSGQAGMDSRPVKFSGQHEAVPSSPKAPSNAYTKGESEVKHAKQWKNAPAQTGQDLEKAPAAVKSQASGVNTKSPVSESRKVTAKKIIKK